MVYTIIVWFLFLWCNYFHSWPIFILFNNADFWSLQLYRTQLLLSNWRADSCCCQTEEQTIAEGVMPDTVLNSSHESWLRHVACPVSMHHMHGFFTALALTHGMSSINAPHARFLHSSGTDTWHVQYQCTTHTVSSQHWHWLSIHTLMVHLYSINIDS